MSYVNIHALNLASELPWFKEYLQRSLLTYCDGEGVRLGAKFLGESIPERIVLSDWISDVCNVSAELGKRVYLLGGSESVVALAAKNLVASHPHLILAGTHAGYFLPSDEPALLEHINSSGADVLIVGMGMPKQEAWIREHQSRITPRIVLNGGSCFDYVAGTKRRCPSWMGRMGLEWLFRLLQEPRRLWKRYLVGNPRFFHRVFRARCQLARLHKQIDPPGSKA